MDRPTDWLGITGRKLVNRHQFAVDELNIDHSVARLLRYENVWTAGWPYLLHHHPGTAWFSLAWLLGHLIHNRWIVWLVGKIRSLFWAGAGRVIDLGTGSIRNRSNRMVMVPSTPEWEKEEDDWWARFNCDRTSWVVWLVARLVDWSRTVQHGWDRGGVEVAVSRINYTFPSKTNSNRLANNFYYCLWCGACTHRYISHCCP